MRTESTEPEADSRDIDEEPHTRFDVLNANVCRDLLGGESVGRFAVDGDDGPLVFPVNYMFDGNCIAFRTDPGTKLDVSRLRRVAFEIDSIDPVTRTGWSVLARGVAHEITDALDHESVFLRHLPLTPWAPGPKTRWIRIDVDHISGRRIRRGTK